MLWADGPMEPIDIAAVAAEHGLGPPETRARADFQNDRDDLLQRALNPGRSPLVHRISARTLTGKLARIFTRKTAGTASW